MPKFANDLKWFLWFFFQDLMWDRTRSSHFSISLTWHPHNRKSKKQINQANQDHMVWRSLYVTQYLVEQDMIISKVIFVIRCFYLCCFIYHLCDWTRVQMFFIFLLPWKICFFFFFFFFCILWIDSMLVVLLYIILSMWYSILLLRTIVFVFQFYSSLVLFVCLSLF